MLAQESAQFGAGKDAIPLGRRDSRARAFLKSVSKSFMSLLRMDLTRTLIIGNSGSGKSWLAERVADRSGAAYVDLDLIHWLPGGYGVPRERADAIRLAQLAAEADRWVIEGIYGWLVNEVLANASALVWLCIDEGECVANIRRRGIRRNGSPEAFDALQEWAATYRSRTGSSSYGAHRTIFEQFHGDKETLGSRDAIGKFVGRVPPLRMSNP
ncbi:adenylate kinase [Burkholderia diffusa]|uniref:adenylate kinase n=1 Tax=Burkholderia diffusa TaxID=488732 RepID=UPI001E559E52|nr:adenylate kinase [Burkholderia diffusa]